MQLKNNKAASAAGHKWEPGDVVEVDDEIAAQLIAIQDSGFYNPDDHPDGFAGGPRFIAPEGPGPTTKVAEWPTEGDDPVKESTVAESPFAGDKPKRSRRKTESEVSPETTDTEVDPEANTESGDAVDGEA